MKKTIALIALFMLVHVSAAFAWWSVPTGFSGSTHHKLTDSAEGLLSGSNYPDIIKFGGDVSDWTSGSTDDIRAHNLDSDDPATVLNKLLDGGPIGTWWDRAQREYKRNNYNSGDWSAYYYIALMMHLTEDQAVPAHAYNIKHGTPGYMDNMEQMADNNYYPNINGVQTAATPISNYRDSITATLERTIANDPNNSYWWTYWQFGNLTSYPDCSSNGDSTYGYASVYGGAVDNSLYAQSKGYAGCPVDAFPVFWTFAGNNERNLEMDLLGQAVGYTAGALISVSMNLPPLTNDVAIDGATVGTPAIDTVNGSNITCNLFENRQPDVYVIITVDSPDGQTIMDADSGTLVSYTQRNLGNGTQLPYEGSFAVKWKGLLADGTYPSSGEHTLYVTVYDHDGNPSPQATINFTIQTPPVVVSTNPVNGAVNVPTDSAITITFNHVMDTASVQGAITVSPALVQPIFTWSSDNKSLTIIDNARLKGNQAYTVTISDVAMDTDGVHLDGDKDGQPGGSYVFSFTTGGQEKCVINAFGGDYFDGSGWWVKSGTISFTVQVLDKDGNAVSTTTPPQITSSAGTVNFTNPGVPTSTWTGSVSISGGDGQATFSSTSCKSLTGTKSFMIDTTPPALEAVAVNPPSCGCPYGPIAVQFNATDSGSGVASVIPVGLGLYANGCYPPGTYQYGATSITDNVGNTTSFVNTIFIPDPPGCDNPDDNFSFNGSSVLPSTSNDQSSTIAVYQGGYYYDLLGEMTQINRSTLAITDTNLADTLIGTSRVFVIPSGGLYGLKNSDMFKAELDEFVKQGGTLVVFAQQHGYDFSILPVPQEVDGTYKKVAGYGWGEDQSCQYNSSYVDTWQQMLSGQSNSTPSLNVDGYFTSFPSTATVILRRVRNEQPSIITYNYGNGHVIATTMYSDYAFGYGQASDDEKALVRDLISWAKSPAHLPEIKQGDAASIQLQIITNNATTTDAASVKIRILDPNRATVLNEQTIVAAIPAGQSVTLPITFAFTATALGIYHTDYILLDAKGNALQTQREADSGRFVVSNPPSNPYKNSDFNVSINSDSEYYMYGSDAVFTVTIWNNSNADRAVKPTYYTAHINVSAPTNTFIVPAHSSVVLTATAHSIKWQGWLVVIFTDESDNQIGSAAKGIWMDYPAVAVYVMTGEARYGKGEAVNLNVKMRNPPAKGYMTTLKVRATDPSNIIVYNDSIDVTLPDDGINKNLSFGLPMTAQSGFYTVSAEVYNMSGKKIGGNAARFEVPTGMLSILPQIPTALGSNNIVSFTIKNTGVAYVSSAQLVASFRNPAGEVIWSHEKQMQNLDPVQGTAIELSLPCTNLSFGDYKLSSVLNYERTSISEIAISNTATIVASLDKLSYRERETADLKLNLTNTGRFNLDNLTLSVSVPDAGFTETRTTALPVSSSSSELHFAIPIPATITPGQHHVDIFLSLPSGSTLVQSTMLTVSESSLVVGYAGPATVTPGDSISLSIENMGGVDTKYTSERLAITDNRGIVIYQGTASGEVLSGVKQALTAIQIPLQTLNGPLHLNVQMNNMRTEKKAVLYKALEIAGLAASLQTKTHKDVYLNTEPIDAISNIANGQFGIDNGSLQIAVRIKQKVGAVTGHFDHLLPKEDWLLNSSPFAIAVGLDGSIYATDPNYNRILKLDSNNVGSQWGSYCTTDGNGDGIPDQPCEGQFNGPNGIAIGPDGAVYVADSGNNRIQKFDRNGIFIAKWGSFCASDSNLDGIPEQQCDGQFNYPVGIAVAPNGSVFVSDTNNHRIQKFDSNGNFISQFGSYCLVDGNWDGIPDQECDGQFAYPESITVSIDGSLFVSDTNNHRIQKFDSNGNFISKWGGASCVTDPNWDGIPEQECNGNFYYPSGVATDTGGFIYVLDTNNNRIQKFDGNGNFIAKWGHSGNETGAFSWPNGIAVSANGSVYVADTGNGRIQKFDNIGTYITGWGRPSNGDGYFSKPYGVAASSDGSIYVADNDNNIQKFDSAGNFITKWGGSCYAGRGGGPCDGQFSYPYGIAVAPDRYVYVIDSGNNRIQKFDRDGNFITKWGSFCSIDSNQQCNGNFNYPNGVAVGPDGSVYVSDRGNNRIQKFDSAGNFLTQWGGFCSTDSDGDGMPDQSCEGQFAWPSGIAVGPDGIVYVVDSGNSRIVKFDSNGGFIIAWGSSCSINKVKIKISDPSCEDGQFAALDLGIAVASDSSVYIADRSSNRIQKFDGNGNFIAKWGSSYGSGGGLFAYPEGMAVGPDGSVYVANADRAEVLNMAMSQDSVETLFTTNVPISQASNIAQDYATNIGVLNAPGKLYLQTALKNSLGQIMATAEYPFYVVAGNTVLLFSTDKKYYQPNETVTITGRVENRATADEVGIKLSLNSQVTSQDSQQLYTETFNVPAGESYPFTTTARADVEGIVTLNGIVTQNTGTLVEMSDHYEISKPRVMAAVSAPDIVGNEPFVMSVEIKNVGKIDANIHYFVNSSQGNAIDDQQMTIPAGDTKLIQYSQLVPINTVYTFTFTGDLNQTVTRTVAYGLSATMTIGSGSQGQGASIYSEGKIAIPVTITNTGLLDETLEVAYQLATGNTQTTTSSTYFLSKGGSISDTLYYDLMEGSYQLSAASQIPTASAITNLIVLKAKKADIALNPGIQGDGLIPVTITLTNSGYNNLDGTAQLTLFDSNGKSVWSGEQIVSQLQSQNTQAITFNIFATGITAGNYSATAALLDNSGEQLAARTSSVTVQGAVFQVTQVPTYQTYYPDQEATFTFKVKNVGNQEGHADFAFKAYDLIDSTLTEWLKPGEEREISFALIMPADLEEKDYFADYTLTPAMGGEGFVKGQAKYHLAGINLTVTASLDKQNYVAGDIAHLTLTVNQQSTTVGENLFARINYSGYEEKRPFTLNGNQTLVFDVPLTHVTGEKLLYGIYYAGGRSIHLNNIYVYKADDTLTITTVKQVYDPGETVNIGIQGQGAGVQGAMTLTGPSYTETFAFTGSATKSFTLPMTMTAGTYKISAQLKPQNLQPIIASYSIDVNGIKVKIAEVNLDKGKYAETDSITANLTMTSNRDAAGTLKTWIADPQGKKTLAGETSIMLSSTEPLIVTHHAPLVTEVSGIHRLVYQVYAGALLVSAGSEAFDVGDAALLSLSTDKLEYPAINELVAVKVGMIGTIGANLELQLDGGTIKNDVVTLSGISRTSIELGTVSPGTHVLKAILTAGGLTSIQETSFVYGSSLPDLTVTLGGQSTGTPRNSMVDISVTVLNQGRTTAGATTVSLYDGESLIETKTIRELPGGETDAIVFSWNVIGKAGDHTLKAFVDPQNLVVEFNKNNNTSFANIRITADTIPPVTTITIGTPKYAANGATIVSSSTRFTLNAVDNSSGVARTEYRVDDSTWTTYAPFTLATDGTHTISYRSRDNEGNSKEIKTLTVIADATPPTGSIVINGGAAYTTDTSVTLTLNCTDSASGCGRMQFSSDSATWSTLEAYSTTKTWALASGDGSKTVYVKYHDSVENPSAVYSANIMLNTIPPVPPITTATPPGGLYKSAQSVTLSTNEPATIYYTTDGTVPTTGSSVYSGPINVTQTTTVWFFAVSPFGISEGVKNATYTIDGQAPVLTLSTLPDGAYTNNNTLNITGTASDANGIQSIVVSGQTVAATTIDNVNYTFSSAIALVTGTNNVTVVATDIAGNNTTDTRTVFLDQNAPQITITDPADNSVTSSPTVTVAGKTDKPCTVLISINSGPTVTAATNATTFSLPITLATNTYNTIIVYATDFADNHGWAKRTVKHDDTNPSLAITVPNQDMGTSQAHITISGTVSDLTDVTLLVTCPTASIGVVSMSTTTWSVDITNMQQGTNAFTVQATDEAGNSTRVVRNIIYTSTPITIDPVKSPTNISQQLITGTRELNSTVTVNSLATMGTITYPTTTTWQIIIANMTQGTNTISATATDLEGHTSDSVTALIVFDIQPPHTSITSGPGVLTNNNSASLSFTSDKDGSTFACKLDTADYTACASPMNYSSLIDGLHTFMVRATDQVGNPDPTPAVYNWTVDTIPPLAVIIGAPPSLNNERGASLTITGDDVITYQFKLDTGSYSVDLAVPKPIVLTNLSEGAHTVFVLGRDSAGNPQKEEHASTASWVVDITPPVLTVSTLPDRSYTNNPVLNIAGTASDANGIQSVVVSGQTVSTTMYDNVNYSFSQAVSLGTGSNTIITSATDLATNTTTTIRTIILDQKAPVITITNPADNSLTNIAAVDVTGFVDKTATILISINSGLTMTAAINATTFSMPITLEYNKNHIDVTAIDLANNHGSAKRTVTLDNLSPALAITNPNQDMGTNQANITISGSLSDLTNVTMLVTCPTASVGVVSRPTSTTWSVDITNMQQGPNAVTVQAKDEAENKTSIIRNIISTQTPVTIDPVRTPTYISQQLITGTMELNSTVTVSCPLVTMGAVTYPTTTTWQTIIDGMMEGTNVISVAATDLEGRTTDPVTATIVLDITPPTTTPSPAPGTYYNTVTVTLAANEPATIYYTVDGSMPTTSSKPYISSMTFTATTTLKSFAVDLATNHETIKSVTYTVIPDTTPPVTTITAGTPNYTSGNGKLYVTSASKFTLSATDDVSGVKTTAYRLDGGTWTTYASPFTILSEGTHTIGYMSTDNALNSELEKDIYPVVDNTPPVSSITVGGPPVTLSTPITITATDSASGVKLTEYNIDGNAWNKYNGSFTLAAYSQGTHTINYRSTDNVMNVETPKSKAVQLWTDQPTITTAALSDGTVGASYSQTLAATGGTSPYLWSVTTGTLPASLALNGTTGTISGTPTSAGTSTITFRVADAHGMTNTKVLSILIYGPVSITTNTLATGSTGTAYSQALVATGGKIPYTWSIASGSLSGGLTLSSTSGIISGTPNSSGISTFTAQVKDANGASSTKLLSISIYSPLVISTVSLPTGTTSTAYSQTLAATGGLQPYVWSMITGALPMGLTLNSSTGVISGSTNSVGTSTFTTQVKDANNSTSSKVLTLTINSSLSIPQNLGVFGATGITISGGYIDSYDSTQGLYNGTHGSNVSIGTNSKTNGTVTLSGGVIDYGNAYVGPGGDPSKVIIMSGGAVINGTKGALSTLKGMTPKSDPGGGTQTTFTNGTTLATGTYRASSINLSGSGKGTINGNVTLYVTGSVSLSGTSQIVILPGGSLTLYINGSLNVSGGSIVNQTLNPHNLTIYGTSTCTSASYSGTSTLYGAIYTPAAATSISGGVSVYGSVIGGSVTISGGTAVHYDASLGNIGP